MATPEHQNDSGLLVASIHPGNCSSALKQHHLDPSPVCSSLTRAPSHELLCPEFGFRPPSSQVLPQPSGNVSDPEFALELSLIHISEPTRLLSISYAVFCLKKKKKTHINKTTIQ
eukprot:TRINITY_DN11527_c0_g1_i5.p1 TRINITY_DN11527_c0_g1~~TRINITY_DN11527_c0_g1_i5.p1  ORF type:complete len:115 (+),score=19.15 TRINITY_DN11527_c0_g1_i5:301-645(+)